MLLGGLVLLCLLLASAWGWLQSGSGKAWIASELSSRLSGIGGQQLRIAGLDGRIPFDLAVAEVEWADEDGVWLRIEGLALKWSLAELVRQRRLHVDELSAHGVSIDRRPHWAAAESSEPVPTSGSFVLPPLLVRTVSVDRITLGEDLLGHAVSYRVGGSLTAAAAMEEISGRLSLVESGADDTAVIVRAGYRFPTKWIDLDASFEAGTNSVTHRLIRAGAAGDVAVDISGAGTAASWTGDVRLASSAWAEAEATIEAAWQPALRMAATGNVHVVADWIGAFPAEAAFTVSVGRREDGRWTLTPALRSEENGWAAHADVVVDPSLPSVEGIARVELDRLAPWLEALNVPVEGQVEIDAVLTFTDRSHAVELSARARDLDAPWGSAEEMALRAELPDLKDPGRLRLDLVVAGASRDGVAVSNLTAHITRDGTVFDFETQSGGSWREPFEVVGAGRLAATTGKQDLRIDRLRVTYAEVAAESLAPFSVSREDERWKLSPTQIEAEGAHLDLSGYLEPGSVSMAAAVTNLRFHVLPFEAARSIPDGNVDAQLVVSGTPSSPVVDLDAWISEIVPPALQAAGLSRAGVAVGASVAGNNLSMEIEATDLPAGRLEADLSTPLVFALRPFAFAWSTESNLVTRLDADLDLAYLNRFGFLADQEVRGRLVAELTYDGPAKDLEAKGVFHMEQAAYRHHRLGLVVKDLGADLQVRDGAVLLERLEGNDGDTGSVEASGRLELNPAEHWPFTLQLTSARATLLRQDHVTATVSADLAVTGSVRQVSVNGRVGVDSGEFRLDRLPPAPPPVLDVVHVGRDGDEVPSPENEETSTSAASRKLRGDIFLSLDGPFFVRGAGIDSSWRGGIRVRSDGGPWRVSGSINPRRGTYEFFGRRFALVNSRVHFDGAYPVVPTLDITAEYERAEITARLRITGRLSDPRLELESEPDLPNDEIMARVMFGTAATGLTPLQTAQLGLAVASMARTGGSSFDFMGRTRSRLGVDELGFREDAGDASGGVELVAGRYVSDRIFLEYSQRVGSREAGLRAEFEINRHLSVETSAGAQLRPGIRINVRRDY